MHHSCVFENLDNVFDLDHNYIRPQFIKVERKYHIRQHPPNRVRYTRKRRKMAKSGESARGYASSKSFVEDFEKYSYDKTTKKFTLAVIHEPHFFRFVRENYEPKIDPKRYRRIIRQVISPQQGYIKPEINPLLEELLKKEFTRLGKKKWNFVNVLTQDELDPKITSNVGQTSGKRKRSTTRSEEKRGVLHHPPVTYVNVNAYPKSNADFGQPTTLQIQKTLGTTHDHTYQVAQHSPMNLDSKQYAYMHAHPGNNNMNSSYTQSNYQRNMGVQEFENTGIYPYNASGTETGMPAIQTQPSMHRINSLELPAVPRNSAHTHHPSTGFQYLNDQLSIDDQPYVPPEFLNQQEKKLLTDDSIIYPPLESVSNAQDDPEFTSFFESFSHTKSA